MKHNNSPSLFSFSLAYVVATVFFGIVLSIVFSHTVAAEEDVTVDSAAANGAAANKRHTRPKHRGNRHEHLSPEERQAHIDAKFSEIDVNTDDMISREELAAARLPHPRRGKGGGRDNDPSSSEEWSQKHAVQIAEMRGKLFESMDSDSDGTLSKDEFAELHTTRKALMKQHMFQRMDRDEDGFLSRDEFPPRHRGS